MIREKRKESGPIVIDLTGPDGNAFVLLATASRFSKQLGDTPEETQALLDRMKSGDYENLIKVFDEKFGDFVILEK